MQLFLNKDRIISRHDNFSLKKLLPFHDNFYYNEPHKLKKENVNCAQFNNQHHVIKKTPDNDGSYRVSGANPQPPPRYIVKK